MVEKEESEVASTNVTVYLYILSWLMVVSGAANTSCDGLDGIYGDTMNKWIETTVNQRMNRWLDRRIRGQQSLIPSRGEREALVNRMATPAPDRLYQLTPTVLTSTPT
ncbi:uncharacterized protein LOC113465023 [Ceratina calcarata]|uniref:Uncharacterized protein LOC113465023 n=1 Tax=Ceratina calcarata TaxID=156304 RepID=A0AAJ7S9M0_9HYME|nr:uncharacterized protein LOC113465023 [Ceratina calcarata]